VYSQTASNARLQQEFGISKYKSVRLDKHLYRVLILTKIRHPLKSRATDNTKYYYYSEQNLSRKYTMILKMRSTIANSVLLSVLVAATTSSTVFADDVSSQRIVGGNRADAGDYPYFGE
jgi:hypothetical protein